MLCIDGHCSHSCELLHAKSHSIHLFCFPGHATAILQPLDVGVYGPVKQAWAKALKEYKIRSRAQNVDRTVFPYLIAQLWHTSFTKHRLQSGNRIVSTSSTCHPHIFKFQHLFNSSPHHLSLQQPACSRHRLLQYFTFTSKCTSPRF